MGIIIIHAQLGWFAGGFGTGGCEYSFILIMAFIVVAATDTEAVKVGSTIYLSGVAGKGDMAVAIKKVYDALGKNLGEFGANFKNVVKENVYATNLDDFIKNKAIRKEYFKGDFPAATWVSVNRLYLPDLILEVELIAVIKDWLNIFKIGICGSDIT